MFLFELIELEKDLAHLIKEIDEAIAMMQKAQACGVGDYTEELERAYLDRGQAVDHLNDVYRKMKKFILGE